MNAPAPKFMIESTWRGRLFGGEWRNAAGGSVDLLEPQSGRVLLDGTDVREWPIAQLRAAIGYVEQDAPVLSGSLRENLLLGAPQATEDEVAAMLRTTRLTGLVARLPDGLETAVGHRGTRLSGGERQRVA